MLKPHQLKQLSSCVWRRCWILEADASLAGLRAGCAFTVAGVSAGWGAAAVGAGDGGEEGGGAAAVGWGVLVGGEGLGTEDPPDEVERASKRWNKSSQGGCCCHEAHQEGLDWLCSWNGWSHEAGYVMAEEEKLGCEGANRGGFPQ
jgi:hypothetical protein